MAAAARQQRLHIPHQRLAGVDVGHRAPQPQHVGLGEQRTRLVDQVAPVGTRQQRAFGVLIGVAQVQAQQEAVELRVRQGVGARQVDRVLGGDDEERGRQRMRGAVDRDLVFGHRLQQCALGARRRAIDLVGEQHMREHRPRVELEAARLRVEHRYANDVRRQQVGGELHALETQSQRGCQRVRQRGLAEARQVLDQQVAVGQQRDEGQPHLVRLAQQQAVDLRLCVAKGGAQRLG